MSCDAPGIEGREATGGQATLRHRVPVTIAQKGYGPNCSEGEPLAYQRSQGQSLKTSRIGGGCGPPSSVGHSVPGTKGGAEPEGVKPPSVFPCLTTC